MSSADDQYALFKRPDGSYQVVIQDAGLTKKETRARLGGIFKARASDRTTYLMSATQANELNYRPVEWRTLAEHNDFGTESPFRPVANAFKTLQKALYTNIREDPTYAELRESRQHSPGGARIDSPQDRNLYVMQMLTSMEAPLLSTWMYEVSSHFGRRVEEEIGRLRRSLEESDEGLDPHNEESQLVSATLWATREWRVSLVNMDTKGALKQAAIAGVALASVYSPCTAEAAHQNLKSTWSALHDQWDKEYRFAIVRSQSERESVTGAWRRTSINPKTLLDLRWDLLWHGFEGVSTFDELEDRLKGLTAHKKRKARPKRKIAGMSRAFTGTNEDELSEAEEVDDDELCRRLRDTLHNRWLLTYERRSLEPKEETAWWLQITDRPWLRQRRPERRGLTLRQLSQKFAHRLETDRQRNERLTAGSKGKKTYTLGVNLGPVEDSEDESARKSRLEHLRTILRDEFGHNRQAVMAMKDIIDDEQIRKAKSEMTVDEILDEIAHQIEGDAGLFDDDLIPIDSDPTWIPVEDSKGTGDGVSAAEGDNPDELCADDNGTELGDSVPQVQAAADIDGDSDAATGDEGEDEEGVTSEAADSQDDEDAESEDYEACYPVLLSKASRRESI